MKHFNYYLVYYQFCLSLLYLILNLILYFHTFLIHLIILLQELSYWKILIQFFIIFILFQDQQNQKYFFHQQSLEQYHITNLNFLIKNVLKLDNRKPQDHLVLLTKFTKFLFILFYIIFFLLKHSKEYVSKFILFNF